MYRDTRRESKREAVLRGGSTRVLLDKEVLSRRRRRKKKTLERRINIDEADREGRQKKTDYALRIEKFREREKNCEVEVYRHLAQVPSPRLSGSDRDRHPSTSSSVFFHSAVYVRTLKQQSLQHRQAASTHLFKHSRSEPVYPRI